MWSLACAPRVPKRILQSDRRDADLWSSYFFVIMLYRFLLEKSRYSLRKNLQFEGGRRRFTWLHSKWRKEGWCQVKCQKLNSWRSDHILQLKHPGEYENWVKLFNEPGVMPERSRTALSWLAWRFHRKITHSHPDCECSWNAVNRRVSYLHGWCAR